MDYFTIALIALGLSMDALAVSIAAGASLRRAHTEAFNAALSAGLAFGAFQGLMPVAGWAAGQWAKALVSGVDHWIAFSLLAFIGGKMVYESLKDGNKRVNLLNLPNLLALALATSIDAFAIGITFALIPTDIFSSALAIGLTTAALSFAGVYAGRRLGHGKTAGHAEVIGGLVLIAIGIKILVEHLTA